MLKQRAKGQHYIPRAAYLEHFADKSQGKSVLWVYQVENGKLDISSERAIPPDKLCKETYMYEGPHLPVNIIEHLLERIESAYSSVFSRKIEKKEPLDQEDKKIVSLFISSLESRVPEMRRNIQGFVSRMEEMAGMIETHHTGKWSPARASAYEKMKSMAFPELVAMASFINRWRFSNFHFLFNDDFYDSANGGFFIISDRPVTLYDFTSMNEFWGLVPISEDLEVLVPLTPRIVLFINNRGLDGYGTIGPNFIKEVNNRVAIYSTGRIISPHRLNDNIVKDIVNRNRQSFILKYAAKMNPAIDSDN